MTEPDATPIPACLPLRIDTVPWQTFGHGERFGIRYQVLSEAAGAKQITVCMEVLEPGKQANQQHYHLLEEEHVLPRSIISARFARPEEAGPPAVRLGGSVRFR